MKNVGKRITLTCGDGEWSIQAITLNIPTGSVIGERRILRSLQSIISALPSVFALSIIPILNVARSSWQTQLNGGPIQRIGNITRAMRVNGICSNVLAIWVFHTRNFSSSALGWMARATFAGERSG
jgi:hypothetical protein